MACHTGASTSSAPPGMVDAQQFESLLIEYHTLRKMQLVPLAERLARDIEQRGLVPNRIDYLGISHPQTFKLYYKRWEKLNIPTVSVLLTPNRPNLAFGNSASFTETSQNPMINRTKILRARELGENKSEQKTFPMEMATTIDLQFRTYGHIDRVYNAQFDRTGRYLFSAADDCIIKCWDLSTGLLRFTFRGNVHVIVDLSISYCNQLMVSVSQDDKRVRVWSLKDGSVLHVLSMHTGEIVGAKFVPIIHPTKRFFVSFGSDCCVNFYSFDAETLEFYRTFIYNVRTSTGAKIFSGGHSADGRWVSVGDNQGNVFLFPFEGENYGEQVELKAFPGGEKIDSLEWCHNGPAFAVGSSKCSSGRIWRLLRGNWHFVEFSPELPDDNTMRLFANTKLKYCVCQVVWSPDDRFIIASGNDNCVRVYDAFTGKQKHCLAGHVNEVYHLHFERIHPTVLLTSAHDGFIFLWDIETGRQLKKLVNANVEDQHGVLTNVPSGVLDVAISPDGACFATTDDSGRVAVYGYGSANYQVPRDQFFRTDYLTFSIDSAGFPDSPIHTDPPYKLIDLEHVPVPEKWQKLMPAHKDPEKCPWLSQRIIPLLDEAELRHMTESMMAAAEATFNHWDFDSRFALYKNPDDVISIPVAPTNSRGRNRAHLPTVQELIQQQDERRAQANMEGYRSEDDESYSDSEFSEREDLEEDESDHDSDYNQGDARPRQERRESADLVTSSGRRVRPRVLDNQDNSSPERPRRPNRRVVIDSDDEDLNINNGADVPGTSQQEHPRPVEQKAKKRPKTAKDEFLKSFPKSMQMVKPQKFPYVAQVGDSIVYCKLGHAAYIERVELLKLFPVSAKMKPPAHVGAEVFCIVDDVKYTRKPYRLTVLRLAVMNRQNKRTGEFLNIRYHDLEGSPDFLILRHHYDAAMAQGLKEGDDMEAVIDGLWWTGTVIRLQPFDGENSDSRWNLLQIRWDNGEEETMSPWECQPKTPGRTSNIVATEDQEIALGQCPAQREDWLGALSPSANKTACCDRLMFALHELSSLETVQPFAYPVNLSDFPIYASSVDYSIDLQTIGERLKSGFYRRLKAFEHDIRYISVAAEQFNEPTSTIVHNSRRLVEAIIRYSNDLSIEEDIKKFYDKMYDLDESEITEYQKRNRSQIDRELIEMAMSSQTSAPVEADWICDTRTKLTEIFNVNSCKHFLNRTTATDPNVLHVMDELGDLDSVKNNLSDYATPSDVVDAINGILMACRDAIEDERSRVRDCATQISNMVNTLMESVIAENTRIINGDGMRRLRKRAKGHAYETRSVETREERATRKQTGPGFYRNLNDGQGPSTSSLAHRADRATRALRRQIQLAPQTVSHRRSTSSRSSRASSFRALSRQGSVQPPIDEEEVENEGTEEVPPVDQNGGDSSSSSESSSDSDSSEFDPEGSEKKSAGRSSRAMSEEMKKELDELMEDAEEDLDSNVTRRSTRNPKRKKFSSDSEDEPRKKKAPIRKTGRGRTRNRDSTSSNQENTRSRRTRRSNQGRNYQDSSDEEEPPMATVSQRGRLRRSTNRYH